MLNAIVCKREVGHVVSRIGCYRGIINLFDTFRYKDILLSSLGVASIYLRCYYHFDQILILLFPSRFVEVTAAMKASVCTYSIFGSRKIDQPVCFTFVPQVFAVIRGYLILLPATRDSPR